MNFSLAAKIRFSYAVILIPIMLCLMIGIANLMHYNREYDRIISRASSASEFSIDFKEEFDYNIYLIIVGNRDFEEIKPLDNIKEAKRIIQSLKESTEKSIHSKQTSGPETGTGKNLKWLNAIEKYLKNLEKYTLEIQENIYAGNTYDENMEILDKDIRIVTSLIQDSILHYLYYETREIESMREKMSELTVRYMQGSVLLIGGAAVFVLLLSTYIPKSITRPIRYLSDITNQVSKGNLSVQSKIQHGKEIKVLSDSLNSMICRLRELFETVKEEQIHLREAELELLQLQINPHFLYNTLDAIVWLAEAGKQRQVVEMTESLSDFFRTSLNQGNDSISIREELVHAESYLKIQRVRYQDILTYEIEVSEETMNGRIPRLTLQPLIENALYHGIKNKRGIGKIAVKGIKEDGRLLLAVSDNGIGMTRERLEQVTEGLLHKSLDKDFYGLYNVNERIRLKFGGEYGISIESVYGEGTEVKIILPAS